MIITFLFGFASCHPTIFDVIEWALLCEICTILIENTFKSLEAATGGVL